MSIRGAEGLSDQELLAEISRGGKIVIFEYCISIVVLSFKRGSDPHLVRAGEGTFGKSWPYLLVSFLFGWWGFPWGFIYTPMTLFTNLGGGRDVTATIVHGAPPE
jgi:hypothetical protein